VSSTPRVRIPGRAIGPVTALVAVVGVVGAALLWFSFTQSIDPDQFAIKQVYFGPGQGIQNTVIGPGLQFVMPGYERLHVFPRDMQILDMNDGDAMNANTQLTEDYTNVPAIKIQTSDGFQVTVDIAVMYRIIDPYTVLTRIGSGRLYETSVVVPRADKILRQSFGRLEAEGFFQDYERMAAEDDARARLQDDLSEWGIQVWGVLVRDYLYDEKFQTQIEAKKIADQRKFKNQAETVRETRLQEKNRRVADMQRQIEEARGDGDLAIRRINADAELYYRQQVAEGDRAVALAEADATRMQRSSLDQAGASNVVGLEMANALEGTQVIVVSTTGPGAVNPLDLDSMIKGW
jgi:regulator of protease activity HflC (stomatin/prohibitin superfamily)